MKTQKLLVIIFLFATVVFTACINFDFNLNNDCIKGEGAVVEKELAIDEFNKIDVRASFNVVVSQGPVQKVVAVGNPNIIDHLETAVIGNEWNIGFEQGCFSLFDLTVYVTVPSIEQIKVSGSGNVELEDFSQENDLTVITTGSGNFEMNELELVSNIYVNMNGSGSFYAQKDVNGINDLNVRVSGSGSFNGYKLQVINCTAITSGSGSCYVSVEDVLNATISGSGDIVYRGSPAITIKDNGSGNLRQKN